MEQQDENITEGIVKRKVARVTLKKMLGIVSIWQEEERQRVALVKTVNWVLPTAFVVLILAFILVSILFFAHPKFRLFAASILLGIFSALALIAWNRRNGRK